MNDVSNRMGFVKHRYDLAILQKWECLQVGHFERDPKYHSRTKKNLKKPSPHTALLSNLRTIIQDPHHFVPSMLTPELSGAFAVFQSKIKFRFYIKQKNHKNGFN